MEEQTLRFSRIVGFTLAPLLPLLVCATGCSWTRFDDLKSKAGVIRLERTGDLPGGFGTSLDGRGTELLVGTGLAPASALYDVSNPNAPRQLSTIDCSGTTKCRSGNATLYEGRHEDSDCGATLLMETASKQIVVAGPCANGNNEVLDVPDSAEADLGGWLTSGKNGATFARTADGSTLAVGVGELGLGWYYPAKADTPILLESTSPRPSLGTGVAVWNSLAALGAPTVGEVHLWSVASGTATYLGCVHGDVPGFGRILSITTDPAGGELGLWVVAHDAGVWSLRPADLDPSGACLEVTGESKVTCEAAGDVTDCDAGKFPTALAWGELSGKPALLLGAAAARVSGTGRAGAVFAHPVNDSVVESPATQLFHPSQPSNAGAVGASVFGTSSDAKTQFVAAGAPGEDAVLLFTCWPDWSTDETSQCN